MGHRSNLQSRNRAMLGMFGPPIVLFLLIVAGLYIYNKWSEGSPAAYERAISDCVRDRTRVSDSSSAQEQAASDCVRDTKSGDSR